MEITEILNLLMVISVCGLLLAGFPVAFTLSGTALIFALIGHGMGLFDLSLLSAFPQRIYGIMTNEILVAVPLFVFMGVMLERSQVAEDLLNAMGRLFGQKRGGLGISVTLVGGLLAASTGIVGATVVTMGLLALPTMLQRGYSPTLACGSIAAAGTLGQIIPPSIVLVLLGDVLSNAYQQAQLAQGIFSPETMSVGDLFAGALIPGLGLVAMYILYQVAVAIFAPDSSPAVTGINHPEEDGSQSALLPALLPPLSLILAVLGSILGGIATPTEAAGLGAVGALMLAARRADASANSPVIIAAACVIGLLVLVNLFDLRLGRSDITGSEYGAMIITFALVAGLLRGIIVALRATYRAGILVSVNRSTLQTTAMVFTILIGAALFSLVFRGFGGDESIEALLSDLPGGVVMAVAIVMAVMFVLGFFLDFIEIIFVVVPIVAPVLLTMGVDPVWLGVMMAINLQTSFLTPPFGFALFYLRGVAPDEIATSQIYRGVLPFVLIQLLALGILSLYPQAATWLPAVIY